MIFQVFDVAANGWLREMYCFSGFGKAFMFDDFAENMELPKIHQYIRLSAQRSIQVIRYRLFVIYTSGIESVLTYHLQSKTNNE
jgi:hypothetical protein